ncbi:MAG: Glu/Leu/Phe/Val dehydrogenase [Bacteroidota bacterium]
MSEVQLFDKAHSTGIFPSISENDHEMVVFCQDKITGLKAIIAVHNTTLGPAMGGLRMWNYENEAAALTDVLRLSRGMTLKNALAGINVGGGKAVIIGDARQDKTEALLRRFGKFVQNLNGKYYTAEDVGMSEEDMVSLRHETSFVTGLPISMGGSGDPSPVTAYGTYLGIKASLKEATGSEKLNGKKVLIQGVGSVGSHLASHLHREGAELFIYDIYPEQLKAVVKDTGAKVLNAEDVYTHSVDVYAPCALGGTLNPDTIPLLNCMIVAGAANNQLLDETRDAKALQERGILYAPDFMVNAGGIINVSLELETYNRERAMQMTEKIYDTSLKIFNMAKEERTTTHQAALSLAEKRIRDVGHVRLYQ